MSSTEKTAYSIIIPSYQSEKTIVACVSALVSQADFGVTEIIVVDSSSDSTPDLVAGRFPEVKLLHFKERKSAGEARNLGIEQAKGRVLLFIDSDCIACPDWFSGMVAAHERSRCAGVGGSIRNGNPQSLISWAGYFLEFSRFFPRVSRTEWVGHIPTCNISFKKRVFEKYGTFPTELYPVEDRVFNERLINQGEKILFDTKIQVRHFHRSDFRALLDHQRRIGWGSARMRMRHGFRTSFLVKSPLLLPLFVPALVLSRLGFLLPRLLFYRLNLLPLWILSLPFYFAGLYYWILGFTKEAYFKKSSSPEIERNDP
jgi:glycosyltransferase involved in cell wall biosynthesis